MIRFACALAVFAALIVCGCDVPVETYPPNELHALVVSTSLEAPTEVAAADTTAVVEAWFGTPLQPRWPADLMSNDQAKSLVDAENLKRAGGAVYSDQANRHFGLFNEHCVTCHGVSGGGNGPASLLQNPYPRDFRAGIFKWKSTRRGGKPTRKDLTAIIKHGAPGTAMPSFAQVADEDLQALVDYVIFLSIRGEFERRLILGAIDELGYQDTRPEDDASLLTVVDPDAQTDAAAFAREILVDVTERWAEANDQVIAVPEETPNDAASVSRGRELFHGRIALCYGCHGEAGTPGQVPLDYDDWTKEFTTRLSITPTDRDAVRPFRTAGALRPRQIIPRTLSDGVFRGGGDPQTLYRRLVAGIAGTPMSAVIQVDQPSASGLTSDQIWDIIHYVRSLGGTDP